MDLPEAWTNQQTKHDLKQLQLNIGSHGSQIVPSLPTSHEPGYVLEIRQWPALEQAGVPVIWHACVKCRVFPLERMCWSVGTHLCSAERVCALERARLEFGKHVRACY